MKTHTFLSFVLLSLVVSCGTSNTTTKGQPFNLESTKWQTEELNGRAIKSKDNSFTIEFASDGRIAAKGSCNVIVGSYKQDLSGKSEKLTLSPMGLTRSACPDMGVESEYVATLELVTSYSVEDGILTLFNQQDKEVVRLRIVE
ncbi:MAG: META domain-containing protein [Rikenellaceae bacterium]